MIDQASLKALRSAAEAVHQRGEWQEGTAGGCNVVDYDGDDIVGVATATGAIRAYIITANPAAIIELIDGYEREHTALADVLEFVGDGYFPHAIRLINARAALTQAKIESDDPSR